jgi:hypothetical protein
MILFVVLFASNVFAEGWNKYEAPYSKENAVAPVQIKDKGIYNLVVSIQFLNTPYDEKPYKSDAYEKFIKRLKVDWSGVAILQILKAKEMSISDLSGLKSSIEAEIFKLADQLKSKYSLDKNVEVVFSVSNFLLLEPKEK